MIYDSQDLKMKYKEYSNINQKISIETKKGSITRIKRGLYSDDIKTDASIIANVCYAPSYLSFEYALIYYGIIPEYVSLYGGTALRIFYGLNRFSEDLDFTLNEKNNSFSLAPHISSIKDLSSSYRLDMDIQVKTKKVETSIESDFAKKIHIKPLLV